MKRTAIALLCLFPSYLLHAEDAEPADTLQMREVTVVASPKENTSFRRQPVSVSTITRNTLVQQQVVTLKGLNHLVPNFYMPEYGSRLTSALYIRGIGSRINTPAVGLYVDDLPCIDKSAFDFNLADVERVDVLRGPQSTLYGRNTMGGLVKVYTRNPFEYQGTDVHLGYATRDNHRSASLTHYHHLTDKLAFSGGGYYEGGDGFFRNAITQKKTDNMKSGGGKMRAVWKPSGQWTLDANVHYDYNHEDAYPYFYEGSLDPDDEQYGEWIGQIANNRQGSYKRSMLNAGLNTQYEARNFTLHSVTGYQNLHDRMFMDQDFLPDDIYTLEQKQRQNTLNEELVMKSKPGSRWQWVSGVSGLYQWLETKAPVTFRQDGVRWLGETINGFFPDLSAKGMKMNLTINNGTLDMGGTFDTPLLNLAMFHQSTLKLAERFYATAGLRLDYEHQQMDYDAPGYIDYDFEMSSPMMPIRLSGRNVSPVLSGLVKNDYVQLLPKVALKYELGNRGNVYATVSRGSRSGGYNIQMFSDLLQADVRRLMMTDVKDGTMDYLNGMVKKGMPPMVVNMISGYLDQMPISKALDATHTTVYKPEYSWNYEAGTHLASSNGRWMADAAVFLIDTRDQQIARFSEHGFGRMMVNAGKSRSCGAEASVRGQVNKHVALTANYGYTHSIFRAYDDGSGTDYSHNYVPFVPQHTCSLDGSYTFFFSENSWVKNLLLGVTYSGAGKVYWTESNSVSEDYYNLLSARAVLRTRLLELELWGKNLTDSRYNTFYFESMSRGFSQHARPLQVGIDLRLHFD